MKVGIMTVTHSLNYGAVLQAYALWKFVSDLGIDAELINLYLPSHKDYVKSNKYVPYRQTVSLSAAVKNGLRPIIHAIFGPAGYSKIAAKRFKDFTIGNIKFGRIYYGPDEIFADPPAYDLYIAGSDQIWNPSQPYSLAPYFLSFVLNGGKKISYAASIGILNLTEKEKEDFKRWLQTFDTISVRESSALALLKGLVPGKQIFRMPDPTFLIDRDEWSKVLKEPNIKQPYVLLYTLGWQKDLIRYCKNISLKLNMPLVVLSLLQKKHGRYIIERTAGPQEFLGYIKNADLVITDSFHGTVFSLILGVKNFYSYVAKSNQRGSRLFELLEQFDLQSHLLSSDLDQDIDSLIENTLDRSSIKEKLLEQKNIGRTFLQSQILDSDIA